MTEYEFVVDTLKMSGIILFIYCSLRAGHIGKWTRFISTGIVCGTLLYGVAVVTLSSIIVRVLNMQWQYLTRIPEWDRSIIQLLPICISAIALATYLYLLEYLSRDEDGHNESNQRRTIRTNVFIIILTTTVAAIGVKEAYNHMKIRNHESCSVLNINIADMHIQNENMQQFTDARTVVNCVLNVHPSSRELIIENGWCKAVRYMGRTVVIAPQGFECGNVVGDSSTFAVIFGTCNPPYYVRKYNEYGELLWQFEGDDHNHSYGVLVGNSLCIYVMGYLGSKVVIIDWLTGKQLAVIKYSEINPSAFSTSLTAAPERGKMRSEG